MILILSKYSDIATDRVVDYLYKLNQSAIRRLSGGEEIKAKTLTIDDNGIYKITINDQELNVAGVLFFWYRTGRLSQNEKKENPKKEAVQEILVNYYKAERKVFIELILQQLQRIPHIGNYFSASVNKLYVLQVAARCGLSIPKTHVIQDIKQVVEFLSENVEYISKPLSESIAFFDKGHSVTTYTKEVTKNIVANKGEFVCPQLLQEKIEKWIELRIFIVDDNMFPMAIFSQYNEQTKIDHRAFEGNNKSRCVPFRLPNEVKEKLLNFMKLAKLNTGSVDMIVTKEREYIFLEVNPVGVVDMVSTPCNYNIEQFLAQTIIEKMNAQQ